MSLASERRARKLPPSKARKRRSHAERTAETCGRIKAAVVESIAEVGFQRTTANEIARRSGLTWGAVQHHFGGKDGILLAVLEDSFRHFAERMADVPSEEAPVSRRVDAFIDRAWGHFGSPEFRSTFEILLHYRGPDAPAKEAAWQTQMFQAWGGVWRTIFGDTGLSRRRLAALQQFTISALTGVASIQTLGGPAGTVRNEELAILKRTLLRELTRHEPDTRSRR